MFSAARHFPLSLSLLQKARVLFASLLGNQAQDLSGETDEALANLMQNGNDQAFNELYDRYIHKIYAFVVRRVSVANVAEDLTSDVFMRAFAKRSTFIHNSSWRAWLYRIAQNRVTDYYRAKKSDVSLDLSHHDLPGQGTSVLDTLDNTLLGAHLERVLEQLDPRSRLALTLKFYNEADNSEIAAALHVSPGNVAVIVHRALEKCAGLVDRSSV